MFTISKPKDHKDVAKEFVKIRQAFLTGELLFESIETHTLAILRAYEDAKTVTDDKLEKVMRVAFHLKKRVDFTGFFRGTISSTIRKEFETNLNVPVDLLILHAIAKQRDQIFYLPKPELTPTEKMQRLRQELDETSKKRRDMVLQTEFQRIEEDEQRFLELRLIHEQQTTECEAQDLTLQEREAQLAHEERKFQQECSVQETFEHLAYRDAELKRRGSNLQLNRALLEQTVEQHSSHEFYQNPSIADAIREKISHIDNRLSEVTDVIKETIEQQTAILLEKSDEISSQIQTLSEQNTETNDEFREYFKKIKKHVDSGNRSTQKKMDTLHRHLDGFIVSNQQAIEPLQQELKNIHNQIDARDTEVLENTKNAFDNLNRIQVLIQKELQQHKVLASEQLEQVKGIAEKLDRLVDMPEQLEEMMEIVSVSFATLTEKNDQYFSVLCTMLRSGMAENAESNEKLNDKLDQSFQLLEVILKQFQSLSMRIDRTSHNQPSSPIDKKLSIFYCDLVFKEKLKEGSFGTIYSGFLKNDPVAIKTLERTLTQADKEQFIREVQIMSRLRHKNIVQIIGVCYEEDRVCFAMELMENGSLYDVLDCIRLDAVRQHSIALEIARGLRYLHQADVIHADIKSANILLGSEWHAKLTDFGLSKIRSDSVIPIDEQSNDYQWLAPEVLNSRAQPTEKADIYGYGMVLWEIVTGKHPFVGCSPLDVSQKLKADEREAIPETIPDIYADLIQRCWSGDIWQRPSLDEIIQKLEAYTPVISPEDIYVEGCKAERDQDFVSARQYYEKATTAGYVRAKTNLGMFFIQGRGGLQDKQKGRELLESAAQPDDDNKGHARAQYNLGQVYEFGDGVIKNAQQALFWYKEAADQGDQNANRKVVRLERKLNRG